jgi:hypothetical protein
VPAARRAFCGILNRNLGPACPPTRAPAFSVSRSIPTNTRALPHRDQVSPILQVFPHEPLIPPPQQLFPLETITPPLQVFPLEALFPPPLQVFPLETISPPLQVFVDYAAKGFVFPGNLVRALNQMQQVPKKQMRGFVWSLFEQGPLLVSVNLNGRRGGESCNQRFFCNRAGRGTSHLPSPASSNPTP